jgi:hypothetical protein
MTSDESGTGVAGSSSFMALLLFPFTHDIFMRVQALLITTIPAFTAIAISTIAVSNRATTSSTMTTQWKSGRASSRASPSAYCAFFFSTLLGLFFYFLRPTRAPVWGQIRNTFAGSLLSTRMISSLWESMDYGWTRRSVCPPHRIGTFF